MKRLNCGLVYLLTVFGFGLLSVATYAAGPTENPAERTTRAEEQEVVDAMIAGFERRRARVSTVRYEIEGSTSWDQGFFNEPMEPNRDDGKPIQVTKDVPPRLESGTLQRSILFDFENNRHRVESRKPAYDNLNQTLVRVHSINAFSEGTNWIRVIEGVRTRVDSVRPHADLLVRRGREIPVLFDWEYAPIFFGHGVQLTRGIRPRPGHLTPKISFFGERYLREEVAHDGSLCKVIAFSPGESGERLYWIDLKRDAAVVRMEYRTGTEVDVSYQKTAAGWLPKSWQITQLAQPQATEKKITTVTVKQIELNPETTDSDFRFEIEPGMYVEDRFAEYGSNARPESLMRYRLEADGSKTPLDARLAPK